MPDDAPYGRIMGGRARTYDEYLRLNRSRGIMQGTLRVDPETGEAEAGPAPDIRAMQSRKRGGPIHRTGAYKLHAGEYVIPKAKVKAIKAAKAGRIPKVGGGMPKALLSLHVKFPKL